MRSGERPDKDRRLVDLVEKLADEYEADLGIRPIVDAVHSAHDALLLFDVDNEQGAIALVERIARQDLDLASGRQADTARVFGINRPAGDASSVG